MCVMSCPTFHVSQGNEQKRKKSLLKRELNIHFHSLPCKEQTWKEGEAQEERQENNQFPGHYYVICFRQNFSCVHLSPKWQVIKSWVHLSTLVPSLPFVLQSWNRRCICYLPKSIYVHSCGTLTKYPWNVVHFFIFNERVTCYTNFTSSIQYLFDLHSVI